MFNETKKDISGDSARKGKRQKRSRGFLKEEESTLHLRSREKGTTLRGKVGKGQNVRKISTT